MFRRLLVVAATAVGALVCGLLLQVPSSPGTPGADSRPRQDDGFQVAGDGTLPRQRPALRAPDSPLSSDERGYAIRQALASLPATARDVLRRPGAEVLLADLPAEAEREGRRRVRVSAYDYHDDRLHQVLVDLTTGEVLEDLAIAGLQPPPSAAERQVALDIALTAAPVPAFVGQFEEITGSPLLAGDQVHVVAAAWLPDATHGNTDDDAECGPDRCVQLLVALPSGQFLSTDDFVVNLSRRTVAPVQTTASGDGHSQPPPGAARPGPSVPDVPRAPGAADEPACSTALVSRTLSTGSAWRMCARIHPFKGLVLEDVQFRPATGDREYSGWMPVLGSLYLAQLNVPYDTGQATFDDITSVGFGDDQLLVQTPDTCGGDTLDVEQSFLRGTQLVERTVPGICLREAETGLGWHSQEGWAHTGDRYVQQGRGLEVSSLSKAGWYEYQQRVTLTDQGTIMVGLGAAGDLAPGEFFFPTDPALGWPIGSDGQPGDDGDGHEHHHAASHWHNATYRVDFGIDTGPQQVEQWDYHGDPDRAILLRGEPTVKDRAFAAEDADPATWWRVVNPASLNPDGHPRSYEIVNDSVQDPYLPLTRPEVSFTNDHPCQEYASANLNADCPNQSVADYVAAETEPLTDPVAWVNVGYHHVVRDEDQSPMPVHWQSFSLAPRDLLSQQATTPPERSCDNGLTIGATGSCVAVNLTPPTITTDTPAPGVGTVLTADAGSWRQARAPLSFQRLWLRDGEPILTTGEDGLTAAATGERYDVTAADLGHSLSVRVVASAAGVTPGSATSAPLAVPSGPSGSARTRPKLRLTVLTGDRRARPRLRIMVHGDHGRATGRVRVRGHGTRIAAAPIRNGRVTVPLPRPGKHRYRVTVTYLGDQRYRKARGTIWVRPS